MRSPQSIPLHLHKNGASTSCEIDWMKTIGEELEKEFPKKTREARQGKYRWVELQLYGVHPVTKETVLESMVSLMKQYPQGLHWNIFFEAISRDKNPDGGKLNIGIYCA